MKYKSFTVEDFVLNKSFRRWVLNPDPENNLYWEKYLQKYPHQLELMEQAKRLVQRFPKITHQLTEQEVHQLWNQIESGMDNSSVVHDNIFPIHSEAILRKHHKQSVFGKNYRYLGRFAAAITILIAVVGSFYLISNQSEPKENPNVVVKETQWGQKLTTFLNDGSEVILNSGSKIEYVEDFTNNERLIKLEGEAYFNVAEDSLRPFRVYAGGVFTEAIGTSFNIDAYQDDPGVNISLVTGKVKIFDEDAATSMFLVPGEAAIYDSIEKNLAKTTTKQYELDWRHGFLVFKDSNKEEVFTRLARWYGVNFKFINQSNKIWEYNATYEKLDLTNVLDDIAHAMNFSYSIESDTVSIRFD